MERKVQFSNSTDQQSEPRPNRAVLRRGVLLQAAAAKKTQGGADFGFNTPITQRRPPMEHRTRTRADSSPMLDEKLKAAEAKARAKASEQQRVLAERRAHYASLQPCDIHSVPWTEAKEINYVDGGSGGILLVDLGGQCVVLKPQGQRAASELLAQHLAQPCGVRVAQVRIVRHGEQEHADILKIHVDEMRTPIVGVDEALVSKIFRRYKRDVGGPVGRGAQLFGVLEYVPGHPLMGMQGQEALTDPGDAMLLALGQLCALDVLINNMDRVPLPVWSNEGNLGNVMVVGGTIMGIDQQVNPIFAGEGLKRYFQKIEQLVAAVTGSSVDAEIAKRLNDSLEVNAGVRLADCKIELVQQGLCMGLVAIARSFKDGSLDEALKMGAALCRDRFLDDPSKWDELYAPREMESMATFVASVAEHIANLVGDDASV